MGQLDNQVAIVNGCTSLGRGIAIAFARENAHIALVDHDRESAEKLAKEIVDNGGKCKAWEANVANEDDAIRVTREIVEWGGKINVLINATQKKGRWVGLEERWADDFNDTLREGILAAFTMMIAVYPHMKALGGGRIINVGSMYGASAHEHVTDASTVDGALKSLSRAAGIEWAKHGILVNYLQTAAPDIPEFREFERVRPDQVKKMLGHLPMRRMADPIEDLGGGALFLASEEGRFLVGCPVFADGGQHLTGAVFEPGRDL